MAKKRSLKEFYDDRRFDWYDHDDIDFKSAEEQHKTNLENCKKALEDREAKDRPIYVSVFHGSGRHPTESCAHELSNSQLLLERGLDLAREEWNGGNARRIEVETHVLREYILEPCNGCYSTASALCNFTCTCFPGDDISTRIYPSILRSDVLLWSTPVNQAYPATRVKTVLDRLISLDGGYYSSTLPIKDQEYRQAAIALSTEHPVEYDPRMFGKVAAYFVSTKDLNNTIPESAPYPHEFKHLTYKDFVIGGLAHQGTEYGWYHADPFYAVAVASHDRELSYDKDEYDKDTKAHESARDTVLAALTLADKHIDNPPELKSKGRVNRT